MFLEDRLFWLAALLLIEILIGNTPLVAQQRNHYPNIVILLRQMCLETDGIKSQ